jgi:DNA-binding SARP family transcriptional activator
VQRDDGTSTGAQVGLKRGLEAWRRRRSWCILSAMPDAETAADVEFRLLGPLEASTDGGGPIGLGGAKQRAFLTILLLHAGELVPRDRIIEDIWGEEAPTTAGHSLEVYASGLRKALGASGPALAARSGGYVLEVPRDAIDVARFERLAAEGREALARGDASRALERLTAALALWRGPALADVAYDSFAQAEIARLDELRLSATEDRIDAQLRLGRHAEIVGELRALVAANPLRERATAELMLALYRTGRQAEALDAYRSARERLADELGIDPSPELRALETAILRQSDELDAPVIPPAAATAGHAEPGDVTLDAGVEREVRKVVSALVVQLDVRSPDGGAPDPERRRLVTASVGEIVRRAAERAGGLAAVEAGALIAVFGVPRVHEDDARRAVVAAFAVRDGIRGAADESAVGLAVDVRIGVDTGQVIASERDPRLLASDVVGSAGDMARAAPAGEIAIGERTRRMVGDDVVVDEPTAAGAFVVRAVTPVTRRATPAGAQPDIVDRAEELAFALGVLERARANATSHLFTILGSPGVGKSRLVDEVVARARDSAMVLTGHCLPFGDGITFWPIAEAVREAASITDADDAGRAIEKVRGLLATQPDADAVTEAIARLLGMSAEPSSAGEAPRAVRRLLETLALDRPLVLVVEDLHWAEPTLLDLLTNVVERASDSALLVLCTARPEFLDDRPGWGSGRANTTSVLLEPLSVDDSSELLARLLEGSDLPSDVGDQILGAAEGNPLFIEQILSMLIDTGVLSRTGDGWRVAGSVAPIPIPPTLQSLLASRLDQLTPAERRVVQDAAVIGKEFRADDVAALAGREASADLDDVLGSLVEKEWLRRDRAARADGAYRFRHVLMQVAAYDAMPKAERSELHERLGSRLEETAGERIAELEDLVGHHFAQAARYRLELGLDDGDTRTLADRAARRLRAAGDRAFLRGDMPGGVALLSAAAELFAPDDAERITLLPRLGTALVEVARFDDALRTLDEAWERSTAAGDMATRADTLFYRTELRAWFGIHDLTEPVEQARTMLSMLDPAMHGAIARCHRVIGVFADDVPTYAAEVELAMLHARRAGDRLHELEILQNLADVATALAQPLDRALEQTYVLLENAGDDAVASNAVRVIALGPLLAHAGRFDEARDVARIALDAYGELGLELWAADSGGMGASDVEWLAGDAAASGRMAEQGLRQLEEMGALGSTRRHLGRCARAAHAQGRLDDAERYVRVGRERGAGAIVGVDAMLRARRGDASGEAPLRMRLDRDLRMAEGERLQTMMELAEVLNLLGRRDEADAVMADVIHRSEDRGDVATPALVARWVEGWR